MAEPKARLQGDEKYAMELQCLYEQFGYQKYKMSRFEEYALYAENKNFLISDDIITFSDRNGTLLALKPDVTLSIVKHAVASGERDTKVYYNEHVYRVSGAAHAIKDILQVGLEHIGKMDLYSVCEVILLAVKSLGAIDPDFILDLSHLGLLSGLLADIPEQLHQKLLLCISQKNSHEILQICAQHQIEQQTAQRVAAAAALYAPFPQALEQAKALVSGDEMQNALCELEQIYAVLKSEGCADKLHLDFSIVNDMHYYNGVIFQGFVKGVPCPVLSGGRYDKLLEKMGAPTGAMGFAVYLDQLERYDQSAQQCKADVQLSYDEGTDPALVFKTARQLMQEGKTVLVSNDETAHHKEAVKIIRMGENAN